MTARAAIAATQASASTTSALSWSRSSMAQATASATQGSRALTANTLARRASREAMRRKQGRRLASVLRLRDPFGSPTIISACVPLARSLSELPVSSPTAAGAGLGANARAAFVARPTRASRLALLLPTRSSLVGAVCAPTTAMDLWAWLLARPAQRVQATSAPAIRRALAMPLRRRAWFGLA